MADRHLMKSERAVRVEEWRRAWFDGWTEGVIWTLAKSVHALRAGGHPEAVGRSAIQSVASEHASPDLEAHAERAAIFNRVGSRMPELGKRQDRPHVR